MKKPIRKQKTFDIHNCLEVIVESTGHCGGRRETGSKTTFILKDHAQTDMEVNGKESEEVRIDLYGDSELNTFIAALEFAYEELSAIRSLSSE